MTLVSGTHLGPYEILAPLGAGGGSGLDLPHTSPVVRRYNAHVNLEDLPGGTLVRQGLEDLALGHETDASLLVLIGAPRLRRLGIPIPVVAPPRVEHLLYDRLRQADPGAAHSRYNALIRTLVSFERAAECAG